MAELPDILANRQCQDPRDMIFGLHTLLNPSFRDRITIDYSQSTTALYILIARVAIEESGGLKTIT